MSRAYRWLLLAGLPLLSGACGADSKGLPSWIATYPGSHPQSAGPAFVFETQDSAEKVLDFYQHQLIQNGLHMDSRGGGEYGGFLAAEDDAHSRSVKINIGRPNQGISEVSISVVAK